MNSQVGAHLQRALTAHMRWCRENAVTPPPELDVLLEVLATTGQRRPPVDVEHVRTDNAAVLLAVDYREAGRRLGVSDRTVRRLVADGRLPVVTVQGAKRIRVEDLATYVASLEAA